MPLPHAAEYTEAIQDLPANFCDPEIRAGRASTGLLGQPLIWPGNFAAVFQVCGTAPGQKWAIKCFTRQVKGLQERYRRIDEHLRQQRLPFMVGFRYLPDEVLVRGQRYPVLKMDWVEGLRLDEFLADCFQKGNAKGTLRMLCEMWVKLARRMHAADVTHGDLQHGNVILVPVPDKEAYNLRLIDYDGLHVPALAGIPPGEVGHAAYQHPERLATGAYGPETDRFSHLLIYTTLRCLIPGGRELWDRHYNEDRLLVGPSDLREPETSKVFEQLWKLDDAAARTLTGRLLLAAKSPLTAAPPLDAIVPNSHVAPLTGEQLRQVEQWLPRRVAAAPKPPKFGTADDASSERRTTPDGVESPDEDLLSGIDQWVTPDPNSSNPLIAASKLLAATQMATTRKRQFDFGEWLGEHWQVVTPVASGAVTLLLVLVVWTVLSWRSSPADRFAAKAEAEGVAKTQAETAAPDQMAEPGSEPKPYPRLEPQSEPEPEPEPKPPAVAGRLATITNSIGMTLVEIPPSEFLMGSPDSISHEHRDDMPQHRVRITRPFCLGIYPVTQGEYEQVIGRNPSGFRGDDRLPVEMVCWEDAMEFCRRLSELPAEQSAGRVYRLPTEAEWEYACRAGSTTDYSFGDSSASLDDYAWHSANSARKTHPVGSKKPNAWGLYDMHGNVSEWCADWYDPDYYASSPVNDPTGPTSGSLRVVRGGNWNYITSDCRSAKRGGIAQDDRISNGGFRVAFTPEPKPAPEVPPGDSSPPLAVAPFDEQTAKRYQAEWATHLNSPVVITNSLGMDLTLIPAGEFLMGSLASDLDARSNEKPQHRVRITRPFYLAVHEVTESEYKKLMGSSPSSRSFDEPETERRAVDNVSWNQAFEFCRQLSELPTERSAGRVYRLPTEAEWEYACRAGSTASYCFGDDQRLLENYAWFFSNSRQWVHRVGQKKPNSWGVYDMHGNVAEWVADWYDSGYYATSPTASAMYDPKGPPTGSCRIVRGGSVMLNERYCRSADRFEDPYSHLDPAGRFGAIGFRVVFTVSRPLIPEPESDPVPNTEPEPDVETPAGESSF